MSSQHFCRFSVLRLSVEMRLYDYESTGFLTFLTLLNSKASIEVLDDHLLCVPAWFIMNGHLLSIFLGVADTNEGQGKWEVWARCIIPGLWGLWTGRNATSHVKFWVECHSKIV